jgi:coenzyme F420 hydrogenase subunit beta
VDNNIFTKKFQKYLCTSCGVCAGMLPSRVEMVYEKNIGKFVPSSTDNYDNEIQERVAEICPGYGYDISKSVNRKESKRYSLELGSYISVFAAQCTDKDILPNATSGGIMSAIGVYLLEGHIVDGVIVTGMKYGSQGPKPFGYIARTKEMILNGQGSKYLPSPTMSILNEIISTPGKYVVIGTPCQIAGLEKARLTNKILDKSIYLTIANFCGGFRDFRETEILIKKNEFELSEITELKYRGNGQPGFMTIIDKNNKKQMLPYPQYAKMTGIMKDHRCRTCIDATGELADISCGDAWLNKFIKRDSGWSITMTRSTKADKIIEVMKQKRLITFENVSESEVIQSQEGNISSKKYRQYSRRTIYKLLRIPLPNWEDGYIKSNSGTLFEFKVFLSTLIFHIAEISGFYDFLIRYIKRKA